MRETPQQKHRTYRSGECIKLPKYLFKPHLVCACVDRKLKVYATKEKTMVNQKNKQTVSPPGRRGF